MSDAVMVPRGWLDVIRSICRTIGSERHPLTEGQHRALAQTANEIAAMLAASTPVGGWEEPVAWRYRARNRPHDNWRLADHDMGADWPNLIAEPLYAAPPPPSVSTDKGSSPDGDTHRVPEGWVLVPKEPTTAMLQGACDKHTPGVPMSKNRPCECPRFEARRRVWERMVAGSQATPQPADGCSSNEGAGA